jgi:hypothetical protein
MGLAVRVQPLQRDLQLLLDDLVSPQKRSQALAQFARVEIQRAKVINTQALGREPPATIHVDGAKNAPLDSVRPGGIIVCDFQLVNEVLAWIDIQLILHSPFKTGRYTKSHALFADGAALSLESIAAVSGNFPIADEYVFINTVPYARKIERGSSTQAPEGVYQVVATLAQRRFGNLARITFSYRTAMGSGIVGGRRGNRS